MLAVSRKLGASISKKKCGPTEQWSLTGGGFSYGRRPKYPLLGLRGYLVHRLSLQFVVSRTPFCWLSTAPLQTPRWR
ncbi:hypothetical protein DPMN_043908 [Dreissena polymorpha]|uniref:Uncharacterized protein n=1 Tax=Dreissena polymorpha TaxID=45954 RepID=A0A9D4D2A9_DREPO|nr:hypothetical protein DPMN_043908 [Dreissena polymorpha]